MKLLGLLATLVVVLWEPATAFPKADVSTSRFARSAAANPPTLGITEAASYLGKYGYLSKSKAKTVEVGGLVDAKSFGKSIKNLQRMLGLEPTGKLDADTLSMMTKPRCGVEDTIGVSQMLNKGNHAKSKFRNTKSRRRNRRRQKKRRGKGKSHRHEEARSRTKRYNLEGNKWSKKDLTYKITNYTPDMSRAEVDRSMHDALKMWSDKTTLTFQRAASDDTADINIKFGSGSHGDYYPFDGRGGTLAHAFFPESGEAHFDEAEHYDYRDGDGVNLLIVAAHEFGHALGLAHSNVPNSLMAPVYQGYVPNYQLDGDDVMAIQRLYGKSDKTSPTTPPSRRTTTTPPPPRRTTTTARPPRRTTTTRAPPRRTTTKPTRPTSENGAMDVCGDEISFDATFFDDERKYMYAFKDMYYWRFDNEGKFAGYPQLISRRWPGLPGKIQAAAYSRATARTYFFIEDKIFRFADTNLEQGFPRPLRHLGLPSNVDAAMQWGGDGLIYVFKKNNFFRFDEYQAYDGIKRYTHRRIAKNWDDIPNNVDAAMQWLDGATYFLKNDEIFKFSNFKLKVDKRYPKDLRKYFIRCPGQKAAPLKFRKRKGKKNKKKSEN